MSTAPERFGSSFYRGLLPAAEQELYDVMLTRFEGGDYSGKLRLRTGESEAVFRAYSALRDDHPELFWLGEQAGELCARIDATGKLADGDKDEILKLAKQFRDSYLAGGKRGA